MITRRGDYQMRPVQFCVLAVLTCVGLAAQRDGSRATLVGWAMLPAATFADGPTSGQFAGSGPIGHTLPLVGRQPVQGFSAVLAGPTPGSFYVMPDNGFGSKANSADALLRVYAVRPDFRTAAGGSATVRAAHFISGAALDRFLPESYITLRDPDRQLRFAVVADGERYTANPASPTVDPAIRAGRLLTGADLDPESIRTDRDGSWWVGDEFGPFLVKTDRTGRVLRSEIGLEGVTAPENPHRGTSAPTVGSSRGFEGLAMAPSGRTLFALVEGTVTGDPPGTLRINEFDLLAERYTGRVIRYRLAAGATNIGDMTAIDDRRFLVIERNGASGTGGPQRPFKKIFQVDLSATDDQGTARKTEIVDLMNISDPDDLNRDGQVTFTFPFTTIEDVLVVDATTLLVINDNNYPGGGGRGPAPDNTEFILIRLPQRLPATF
jgi:hypothetical protein